METIGIALVSAGHTTSIIGWECAPGRTPQQVQELLILAESHVRKAQHPHPPKDLLR